MSDKRVVAFTALHYGLDYLPYAMESVAGAVDLFFICYSRTPSHGHRPHNIPACPDSEKELERCAKETAERLGKPIFWRAYDGFQHEGIHRGMLEPFCREQGLSLALVLDSDEVWVPEFAEEFVRTLKLSEAAMVLRTVGMHHAWRSFDHFCTDPMAQARGINFDCSLGEVYLGRGNYEPTIFHFGYAIRETLMAYKWKCHGHLAELRSGWLDRWTSWEPGKDASDLHPTCVGTWNASRLGRDKLPKFMAGHPFYSLSKIV